MHKYSLQPTIELKTPLQINFEKCSERKGCSKRSKIQKNFLQICPFFSTLWACNPQHLTSAKTDSKKSFLCVF